MVLKRSKYPIKFFKRVKEYAVLEFLYSHITLQIERGRCWNLVKKQYLWSKETFFCIICQKMNIWDIRFSIESGPVIHTYEKNLSDYELVFIVKRPIGIMHQSENLSKFRNKSCCLLFLTFSCWLFDCFCVKNCTEMRNLF